MNFKKALFLKNWYGPKAESAGQTFGRFVISQKTAISLPLFIRSILREFKLLKSQKWYKKVIMRLFLLGFHHFPGDVDWSQSTP